MHMEILKIIYEHDMTLEHLSGDDDPRNRMTDREHTLASFLAPQKTYNRYYFTGTNLDENRFGLSSMHAWPVVREMIGGILHDAAGESSGKSSFAGRDWHRPDGTHHNSFSEGLEDLRPYDVLISGDTSNQDIRSKLILDDRTGVRERFEPLTALLDRGHLVILAEKAHHGCDLHLFCRHNLYEPLFHGCKDILNPGLRCFTINGKRVNSERHFYFETWSLDRPPHGFQEVTPDARIR
ncbi:MAG: hypothetical protein EA363_01085 [Balneolaceae bacterium]|nr:MAG: hypothetical protein EA363_01085 [Balneolaceae bacterium]